MSAITPKTSNTATQKTLPKETPKKPPQIVCGGKYTDNKEAMSNILQEARASSSVLQEMIKRDAKGHAIDLLPSLVAGLIGYGLYYSIKQMENNHLTPTPTFTGQAALPTTINTPEKQFYDMASKVMTKYANAMGIALSASLIPTIARKIWEKTDSVSSAMLKEVLSDGDQNANIKEQRIKRVAFNNMMVFVGEFLKDFSGERHQELHRVIEELRASIDKMSGVYPRDYDDIDKSFYRICSHLSYPTQYEDVYQMGKDGDPEQAKAIQEKQDKLVSSFKNPKLEGDLHQLINLARYASYNRTKAPIIVLLDGPPSVGKTWVTRKITTEILNGHVAEMSIPEYLEFTGVKRDRSEKVDKVHEYYLDDLKTVSEPHKTRMTSGSGNLNTVAFMDEVRLIWSGETEEKEIKEQADDLNKSFTKPLEQYAMVPTLNFSNPEKPLVVVLATNYFPTELLSKMPSLRSRINLIIRFPNWTEEGYRERIEDYQGEILENLKEKHHEPVVKAIGHHLKKLGGFIFEQLPKFNKSSDETIIYLREVHSAMDNATTTAVSILDSMYNQGKSLEGDEISSLLEKSMQDDVIKLFQTKKDEHEISKKAMSKDNPKEQEKAKKIEEILAEVQERTEKLLSSMASHEKTDTNNMTKGALKRKVKSTEDENTALRNELESLKQLFDQLKTPEDEK